MEDDQGYKDSIIVQIWQEGVKKAGALKFLSGETDNEVHQIWIETIDLMMGQFYESPDDFNKWKQQSPNEKYKELNEGPLNFEGFKGEAQSLIDFIKTKLSNTKQAEDENARNIISRAISRAANRDIESVMDIDPCKGLVSSEKMGELGVTKEKLTESLLLDPQVKAVDCINGEFIVKTIRGEIKFCLVFGDEASGGKA